jgi:ribosomal protein S18 acetylase RimI-like enzyme
LAADYAGIPVVWISNETSEAEAVAVDNMDEHFTVIDHYRLREIRATDAAALCVFYNKALGAGSKAHFHPLGQQTDDTTCMHIASGSADQSYPHRMDLVITSASSTSREGRIMGWAFWIIQIITGRWAEIGIALADAQQGRGLGKKLMQALIDKAEEKQLAELMLNVYLHDDRAIVMYHNFGFKIESTFQVSTGKQEHIMRLILP